MSRTAKVLARLRRKPLPSDLRWDELVRLLQGLGMELTCGTGSRRHFEGSINGVLRRFNCHEPHPHGIVKQYVLRELAEKLDRWGVK